MDTSEEYIKMCDCPEIQEHSLHDGGGQFYAWRSPHFKKQVHVDSYPGGKGTSIWLPRQDQIQEMLGIKLFAGLFILDDADEGARLSYMVGRFKDFVHTKCEKMIPLEKNRARVEYFFSSLEQLWLAFYMFEKHKKIWDGKKWKL